MIIKSTKYKQKGKSFQNILCKIFKTQQPCLLPSLLWESVGYVGCGSLSECVR